MFYRILQIGVVALSLALIVVLFATTKSSDTARLAGPNEKISYNTGSLNPLQVNPSESATTVSNQARATIAVQGMTCSGCISQIKASLDDLDGIGDVHVDLKNGHVTVTYDSAKLRDTGRIAEAITAAGYPAKLKQNLTAKQIENENRLNASKSTKYIARVGDWEILRTDYETELKHARQRYRNVYGDNVFEGDRGRALITDIKSQVVLRLIDEGVQLNEIRKSNYKIPSDTYKKAFNRFLKQRSMSSEEFKRTVNESGLDYDYFLKKFENRVTINTYVEEHILSGLSNEQNAQQQYTDWFKNARLLAVTVYYDKEIETIVKSSNRPSGCQNSCTKGGSAVKPRGKGACVRKSGMAASDCGKVCTRQ
jgi:copper chaperone CopZ